MEEYFVVAERIGPNRQEFPNANDTLLGRVNLFLAQVGGRTADDILDSLTVAALGAQEGLKNHVGLNAEFALNVIPVPRSMQYGPFPGGVGLGGSAELDFKQGLTGNQHVTAGRFGAAGALGVSFNIPFYGPGVGGKTIAEVVFAGGAGPGGALKFGLDANGNLTEVKITIGVGYGFEMGTSAPFPKK